MENFAITKGGNIKEGGNSRVSKKDKDKRRQEARWFFPLEDWHKANFDGVSKGNPDLADNGGIIRNSSGG